MKGFKATFKELFSLALPLIFSNIVSSASGIISMFYIAQINTHALAAGAVISSSYSLLMMMALSILYSISISIGHSQSGKTNAKIHEIIASGMGLCLLICIPMLVICLNIGSILQWIHQPAEVSQMAGDYFRGFSYGLLPMLLIAVFNQFFMGIKKPRLMLYFTFNAVLINACMSYLLIFGYGPIKPLALYGAGLASSITATIQFAIILAFLLMHPSFKAFHLFSKKIISFTYGKLLFNIGFPISIQYSIELLAFSTLTYFMGILGTDALAAQQISLQLSLLLIMINMGMSQAGSILISHHLQSEEEKKRILIHRTSVFSAALLMLLIGLFYLVFSRPLIGLYLNIHQQNLQGILSLAQQLIAIAIMSQFFDSGRNIAAGLLRGYGDSKTSMWTSLISCWIIGLPLALVLAFVFHLGAVGLRLGMMIGIIYGCLQLLGKIKGLSFWDGKYQQALS